MAWNPEPEVAVARDAAKALGDSPMCVVIWITKDAKHMGAASYGRTPLLCEMASRLGQHLYGAAIKWEVDNE